MIHILVMIVKITGWILLGVLGLILGILLFVLFSAIRYQIDGTKNGKLEGKVKLTWLLWILSATVHYQDGLSVQAKLFGRTVWKMGDQEKPPDASQKGDGVSSGASGEASGSSGSQEGTGQEGASEGVYLLEPDTGQELHPGKDVEKDSPKRLPGDLEDGVKPAASPREPETGSSQAQAAEGENAGEGFPKGNRLHAFAHRVKEWILSIIRKAQFSIQSICGKLKQAEEKISWAVEKWAMAQAYIQNPANQRSAKLILRQVRKLFTYLLPRKGSGVITFGLEDPYQMGQILSAASFVYPFAHKHVTLYPVFGQKLLEGEVHIRGRIRIGILLGYMLRLLLDGNIRKQLWGLIRPPKKQTGKKVKRAAAES